MVVADARERAVSPLEGVRFELVGGEHAVVAGVEGGDRAVGQGETQRGDPQAQRQPGGETHARRTRRCGPGATSPGDDAQSGERQHAGERGQQPQPFFPRQPEHAAGDPERDRRHQPAPTAPVGKGHQYGQTEHRQREAHVKILADDAGELVVPEHRVEGEDDEQQGAHPPAPGPPHHQNRHPAGRGQPSGLLGELQRDRREHGSRDEQRVHHALGQREVVVGAEPLTGGEVLRGPDEQRVVRGAGREGMDGETGPHPKTHEGNDQPQRPKTRHHVPSH